MRAEYPTIEELKDGVKKAEEAVASAAKRRDFANAASLQLELGNAKERLEEALLEEEDTSLEGTGQNEDECNLQIDGIDSRADLENELKDLHAQIDDAISKKNFKLASELQSKLNEREKLRQLFPTVEELEKELGNANASLEDAIASKNFESAAKWNEKISEIEKKIEAEKQKTDSIANTSIGGSTQVTGLDGKEIMLESRRALETEIKTHVSMQANEISSKNFAKAQEIQAFIDRLESLRGSFLTASELRILISEKKEAMDMAIYEKKFADAETIDKEISSLTLKLKKETESDHIDAIGNSGLSQNNMPRIIPMKPVIKAKVVTKVAKPTVSVSSVGSFKSLDTKKKTERKKIKDHRQVAKLRPKKPLISSVGDSVLSVTQMLATKRGSASLVISDEGGLAGIITDTDITRRLVAKQLDSSSTSISKVMTPNPTCVSLSDSAMDAMSTMVENHFRHLPVVDDKGGVVGLLDIAKCLNDAISKLEKSDSKSGNVAQDALNQVMQAQGAQGAQAAALQALLAPLMSQAFGSQVSPSLRSLLPGKPNTVVHPTTSVYEAGMKMAESRKAALIVEDGKLVGIFGFKDMMTRVVAKELPMNITQISAVMTPNPESVSPEMTVLEALQTMHENKFLTLPVCEENGTVVGVVNVMDVIYGCGGADGWRSIFSTTLDLDDLSDEASIISRKGYSIRSGQSSKHKVGTSKADSTGAQSDRCSVPKLRPKKSSTGTPSDHRSVAKLRPKKPLISSVGDSVLSVTQMLATKRGSASLVISDEGGLAGIITDTDITRRLVAKQLDSSSTSISKVMTPNPTCVSLSDSAMDAMSTMVENHFRHLPVVDDKGGVVGLLDIAKCLNDAISKLEKSDSKSGNVAQDALNQVMQAQGAQGAQAAALQALLAPLMSQAFGSQVSPSLRSLLPGKPNTVVHPTTSVYEAGMKMAESRKAALIVEDGKLVGIFGFKDMMTRVVAKELPMNITQISAVMTPNPESVSPEMTVLEALQTMHENKFLTLPVCEENGTVVGVVNVMDVIYGCGGADGWRSIFSTALDLDDLSDEASLISRKANSSKKGQSIISKSSAKSKNPGKTVQSLRPKKSIIASIDDSILAVTKTLAINRSDAAVLVDSEGQLKGIITDTDITRRVVAKGVDVNGTSVSKVMTQNPKCVNENESAMDAMVLMIENKFRHIPVVNEQNVVGTLEIAKCLNDAVSKLEGSASAKPNAAEAMMKKVIESRDGADTAALQAILYPLLSDAFGAESSIPSLGTITRDSSPAIVSPETSVFDAAHVMAEKRKAALIVMDGQLIGIFGFKDMMTRVVAAELDQTSTTVS